jgi:hypothetical protein
VSRAGIGYAAGVEETWVSRDLPVLRAIVEAFDDPDRYRMSLDEIENASGFSEDDVHRALRALHEASSPFIKASMVSNLSYPIMVHGVTERARVVAGQWPKPEDLVDALARAFEDAAQTADPDERSRLQRIAGELRGAAREIAIRVLTAWSSQQIGPGP